MYPLKNFIDQARIAVIDHFLSPEQCQQATQILAAADWQRSTIVEGGDGEGKATDFRTSDTLYPAQIPAELRSILDEIESEVNRMLGTAPSRWEGWQCNRYGPGQQFKPHYDTGLKKLKNNERELTVLVTLHAPLAGGATSFVSLGRDVDAVAGRCLIWSNLDRDGEPSADALHAGSPVIAGEKIALVNWIRQYPLS